MFQMKKEKKKSFFTSVNQPDNRKYKGISAFPPYATEEEIAQVQATGKPLHASPIISRSIDGGEREADIIAEEVTGHMLAPSLNSPLPMTAQNTLGNKLNTAGESLPQSIQQKMEQKFGGDLSAIRIHKNKRANRVVDAINARAFASGTDIAFGSGEYQPGTNEGRALIAHEVVHTLQPAHSQTIKKKDPAGFHNPKAYIPLNAFIKYIEMVEKAYPEDDPGTIVSRIRKLYYGELAFEQLIKNQKDIDVISEEEVPASAYEHLVAQADENQPKMGDNPSPYIVMPDGKQIDVGHLLLGIDALLHPGSGWPYTTFGITTVEPTTWFADLGLAVVWMVYHENEGKHHGDVKDMSGKPTNPHLKTYYKLSAPEEDLLADIDMYKIGGNMVQNKKLSLSQALRLYYQGEKDKKPQVQRRWYWFCLYSGLSYTRTDKGISWTARTRKYMIDRVNYNIDLLYGGKSGTVLGTVVGVEHKKWKYTEAVVDMFLDYIKKNLEEEFGKETGK